MDIIWKGIAGRLVIAAIVWLPGAAIPCPAFCRCFRLSP
jgi:hypothetical protein